ncbi:hypothetical protein ELS19_11460 [Halogeometricum borinquense]|uniref:Small CPxCG-related zinc finger protein n=1 Tax=Halogeometricum borinquense TaxID=60847 RepID=A0A482TH45_9EURY|nr:hypothetical protein ELS19_11460 [Halogeometricum borinquense]
MFKIRVEFPVSDRPPPIAIYLRIPFIAGCVTDSESTETVPGRPCPFCGTSMAHRHCKYVCPTHGVIYDCSDTFW